MFNPRDKLLFGAVIGHKTAQYHGSASRPAQRHGSLKEHLFTQIHCWITALQDTALGACTCKWSLEERNFVSVSDCQRAFCLKSHTCSPEVFGYWISKLLSGLLYYSPLLSAVVLLPGKLVSL